MTRLTPLWQQSIHGVPIIRDVFIETGTKAGDTLWEAKDLYPDCRSIEIDPQVYARCVERFIGCHNVQLYRNDSRKVLSWLLNTNRPTTFYLDAHCEGAPSTVNADTECPLLDELRIITAAPWRVRPLVLIDDMNMMHDDYWNDPATNHGLFTRDHWPTFEEIEGIMKDYQYWQSPDGFVGAWV